MFTEKKDKNKLNKILLTNEEEINTNSTNKKKK